MVSRYQPNAGMASASSGEYVEFTAYETLATQYQILFESALIYVDQIASGDVSPAKAKAALIAIKQFAGQ